MNDAVQFRLSDDMPAGAYPDIPNDEYHAGVGLSSSGIKTLIEKTHLHFWLGSWMNPDREIKPSTKSMDFGTAFHMALLEPHLFTDSYIVAPEGIDRRSKAGKEWFETVEQNGQKVLRQEEDRAIHRMVASAMKRRITKAVLENAYLYEVSLFWHDTVSGYLMKCRPDIMIEPCERFPHGLIADVKTCESAAPDDFIKSVLNYKYHVSAAHYCEGFQRVYKTSQPPVFVWLAFEKEAPFAAAEYAYSGGLKRLGEIECRAGIDIFAECMQHNRWDGYEDSVLKLDLPKWAEYKLLDLTVGDAA